MSNGKEFFEYRYSRIISTLSEKLNTQKFRADALFAQDRPQLFGVPSGRWKSESNGSSTRVIQGFY